jgi:hypothetical protein
MSQAINIELTEKAKRLLESVNQMPSWTMDAVCLGMDKANNEAIANIMVKHLTGEKVAKGEDDPPYPPEEHRLRARSERLRKALWASPTVASGMMAQSEIGDNVVYAKVHEFGGVIHHKARTGTARLRTDKRGNLLRQVANANLAIFAGRQHKLAKEVAYKAAAHDVVMPERAPIRTGIREVLEEYGKAVSREIVKAWGEHT